MNEKYPLTSIGILDSDARRWYEAEQCWNCEPEDLQNMQIKEAKTAKRWLTKHS